MAAGIEHARGEMLVTMDGDLQNDPADIALLLEQIDAGFDIVVGWRHNRQDKLISRKIPSRIANWLIGKVTGVPIRDNGCSLKAFRAEPDQAHSAVLGDAPFHSGDGVDRRAARRADPRAPSRAALRPVEVRSVAHLQGAARPDGDQDDRDASRRDRCAGSRCCRCRCSRSRSSPSATPWSTCCWAAMPSRCRSPAPASIFLGSALILLCSGALAELIYSRGDVRDREFLKLTQTILATARNPDANRAL